MVVLAARQRFGIVRIGWYEIVAIAFADPAEVGLLRLDIADANVATVRQAVPAREITLQVKRRDFFGHVELGIVLNLVVVTIRIREPVFEHGVVDIGHGKGVNKPRQIDVVQGLPGDDDADVIDVEHGDVGMFLL